MPVPLSLIDEPIVYLF